ncbi:MAG: polyphosphate polymerase domain-containing protein [Eggerthellaceae bacterium]|nr:polyphosphate polymerase domain-containing protein [Eggerthellaceae bacterium]
MASYNNTFQRKEVKYRLSPRQLRAILAAIEGHMKIDRYGDTVIESRYYDTPCRELIERSLDKPLYKEKLRLRSYGPFAQADIVYVELKKKYKGIVYKRRIGMSKAAAESFMAGMDFEEAAMRYPLADAALQTELLSAHGRQIAAEIRAFCLRYPGLVPSMDISVVRRSYEPASHAASSIVTLQGAPSTDLRITFDMQMRGRDLMRDGLPTYELAGRGEAVMEIKSAGSYPLWLVEALSAHKIYPQSFSKYGEAYRQSFKPAPAKPATPVAIALTTAANVAVLKGSASCLKAS